MEAGRLCGAPAAFTGNDLVSVRRDIIGAHKNWLKNAPYPDRVDEGLQPLGRAHQLVGQLLLAGGELLDAAVQLALGDDELLVERLRVPVVAVQQAAREGVVGQREVAVGEAVGE